MLDKKEKMKVLVACEFSGTVRDAFIARGHDAMSCDLLPTEKPGPHHLGDVLDILYKEQWDLLIAHPPCTYLTNAGVSWLHKDKSRWAKLDDGAEFFKKMIDAPVEKICVENPIMHKYALGRIGNIKPTQIIQPWMFGHTEQKATCLWLKNLPKLVPTNNVKTDMMKLSAKERQRIHYTSPGPNRWKIRSKTFQGIADAMAAQWR